MSRAAAQTDLFGPGVPPPPALPEGMYERHFLSPAEEAALIDLVASMPLEETLLSATQSSGFGSTRRASRRRRA